MNGVYRALVHDVRDPADAGRIKVTIPAISGGAPTDWIWPVVSAGYVVRPKPGDQVYVMFEAGDVDNPVWIGKVAPSAYGVNKTATGYATLIERVEELEDDVTTLQGQVSTLQGQMSTVQSWIAAH